MKERIVRLAALRLVNIKNVENGRIIMPNALHKRLAEKNAEVLGIYGQNGSGKTAVADTFYYLRKIMTGGHLEDDCAEYIDANFEQAEIEAEFIIYSGDIIYEAGYRIILHKADQGVEILQESLGFAKHSDGFRSNKTVFMDYRRSEKTTVFTPKKRFYEAVEGDKERKTDLMVAKKIAEKSKCSYIFGENSREIFCREYENNFKDCSEIIKALYRFADKELIVIRSTHSGVILADVLLPVPFQMVGNGAARNGNFRFPLKEPAIIHAEQKNILDTVLEQMNTVLYTIIPGLHLEIKDYGIQMTDSGEKGYKIELLSVRDNIPPIPIRMESDGIIKIISIMYVLIRAFGKPSVCLVIDELDSGIFEYMLGELLDIFNRCARGQLIFTSHNLRALEMLEEENIMFSTNNPSNRFIHMKKIHCSRNLRDVYLRGITLGGQEEVIYEETDSLKIARAFRKAGRNIRYE